MAGTLPLYGLDASTIVDSPQCSASGEFCFLCTHEADTDQGHGTQCLYTSIVDLIHHMSENKKELPMIARTVQRTYNETVRDSVSYVHPETQAVVEKPNWSLSSITRHLLYSCQFDLFNQVIRHMLHAIVVKQNATMVCSETQEVFEDKRQAFVSTIKSLESWERHINKDSASSSSNPSKKQRRD